MLRKVLSLSLALVLCVSCMVVAIASDNARNIQGEVDIKNPVFRVAVPTNLNFALDPLELGGQSQIYSGAAGYNVINKTVTPIRVDFNMMIVSTNGVTLVATPGSVSSSINNQNQKELFIGVHGAKSVDASKTLDDDGKEVATALSKDTQPSRVVATYGTVSFPDDWGGANPLQYASYTNVVPFDVSSLINSPGNFAASKKMSFLVGPGDVPQSGVEADAAPTADSVASFRLYGKMTTYNSTWSKNDLTFTGVYDFMAVKQSDYETIKITDGTNYGATMVNHAEAPTLMYPSLYDASLTVSIPPVPPAGAGTIVDGTPGPLLADLSNYTSNKTIAAFSLSQGSETDYVIPFYFASYDVTEFSWLVNTNKTTLVEGTDFTVDKANYQLILHRPAGSTINGTARNAKACTLKLSNGTSFTFTMTVTA